MATEVKQVSEVKRVRSFKQIINQVKKGDMESVVVVCPEDEIVMRAVKEIQRLNLLRCVLVGDYSRICGLCEEVGVDIHKCRVISTSSQQESCKEAVMMCRGGTQFLMKGNVDTKILLGAAVAKENRFRKANRVMSHIFLLKVPHIDRFLLITDAGMIIEPTEEERKGIITNAVEFMKWLGIQPVNVALLAAIEKVNDKMPLTVVERKIQDEFRLLGANICGPISLDVALRLESAQRKGFAHTVAGKADVLVVPEIHGGNNLAKWILDTPGTEGCGLVLGGQVPIVLTSRGDDDPMFRVRSAATAAYVMREQMRILLEEAARYSIV